MNKALISKQYWRICDNPNSLLTKTLKAKYCPHEDIHTHKPKPHSSWIWRTIMGNSSSTLSKGSWRVGRGHDIPLNHPFWYLPKTDAPQHLLLQTSSVADLIDQSRGNWKIDIIPQINSPDITQQILSLPLPKLSTFETKDTIIWPHTHTCTYQVKKAYELLHKGSIHRTTPSLIDITLFGRSYGSSNSHIKSSLSHGKSFTMQSQSKLN
jgi:hypothetical protein